MASTEESTKDLPVENCCWIIGKVTDVAQYENNNDDDGDDDDDYSIDHSDEECMLLIMDEKGAVIATDMYSSNQGNLKNKTTSLLKDAMLKPLTYKPRRPKFVIFKDMDPLDECVLEELGITTKQEHTSCVDKASMLCCSVCRRQGSPSLFKLCESCQAVYYCSDKCEEDDMKGSHTFWCPKMVRYMANTDILAELPFSFVKETSRLDFDHPTYKVFLERYGIYGRGFWIRELYCLITEPIPTYGDLNLKDVNPTFLEEGQNIIHGKCINSAPEGPLTDWSQYYIWRDFKLDSPLSILMNFPLTVYFIITSLLPKHYPDSISVSNSTFTIHLIGAEKEADFIPLFQELSVLLPDSEIEIVMIGPELSKKVDDRVANFGTLKIRTKRGYLHTVKLSKPNIVIGLNAGLGAYPTWGKTLIYLKNEEIPAYFTDYCAYSCECAKGPMEGLKLGTISEPIINPFRSPVRKFCNEQRMPWYSNAFIYRLMYGVNGSGESPPSHTKPSTSTVENCPIQ